MWGFQVVVPYSEWWPVDVKVEVEAESVEDETPLALLAFSLLVRASIFDWKATAGIAIRHLR